MKIKIYSEFSEEIIEIWRTLENEGSSTIFQRLDWVHNWYNNVGWPIHKTKLCMVTLSIKNNVEVILPIGISTKRALKQLEWLGGIHSDYMGPVISSNESPFISNFEIIWNDILKLLPQFDILYFNKQVPYINDCINPFFNMKDAIQITNSYQANFNDGWEKYISNVSNKVLADTMRQRRRLSKLGNLKYENLGKNEENKKVFFEKLFKFKSLRYKEMGVEDVLKQIEHREFYLNMPLQISPSAKVHCSVLKLDEEIIALHWGVVDKDTFYYLMPAYSGPEWAKYSPGKVLLEDLMISCIQDGVKIFDFTSGDEAYKKIWSNKSFPIKLLIRPYSILGKIYIIFLNLKKWLSQFTVLRKVYKKIVSSKGS
tara:strand:- start:787 stop:1896 length:1110 start_codon:yes stop_codon:yes gene_type:complete